ncbi:DUF222 domain-containing protein [Rhodococcus sp. ABRD24]|nr:DUF222 domain-containing protein [Rhodococcus sp. ABRD24]
MNPGGIIEPGTAANTLHADDIRRLPEPELLTAAVQISHEIARLETLRVAAVTEIDQRPVALDTLGFRSVKMWLASTTLLEVPAAARILALGKALESCRNILLDCATGPTANTDTLRGTITKLERIFESAGLPASEDTDRNELHASKTLNGRIAAKGDFDNETGEMLLTALSTLTKPRNPIDDPANTRTPGQGTAAWIGDI